MTSPLVVVALLLAGSLWLPVVSFARQTTGQSSPSSNDLRNGWAEWLEFGEQPKVLWTFRAETAMNNCLAVQGEVLFAVGDDGSVYALDTGNGDPLWRTAAVDSQVTGLHIDGEGDDALIFVAACRGDLVALRITDGEIAWKVESETGFGGPVASNGVVFAGGFDGLGYAFDRQNGQQLWTTDFVTDRPDDPPGVNGQRGRLGELPARPQQSTTDDECFYFSVFDQCRVIAVDAKTGDRRWAFQAKGWIYGTPVVTARQVFIGSQDRRFYCLDRESGAELWDFQTGARIEAPAAVDDRHVYVGSCDGLLHALTRQMGGNSWSFQTERDERYGGPIYCRAIIARNEIVLPALRGRLYAIDREAGTLKWSFQVVEDSEIVGQPCVSGQRLFLVTRVSGSGADARGESVVVAIGY